MFLNLCFVAPFSHFVTIITRTSFCVHLKDHNFWDAHQLQWVKNKLICSCNLVEYISFFNIICIIFAYSFGCSSWVGQISLLWIINSTWSWYGLSAFHLSRFLLNLHLFYLNSTSAWVLVIHNTNLVWNCGWNVVDNLFHKFSIKIVFSKYF